MDSKKTKIIETSSLQIKGNLVSWSDVRIQASNISAVTAMNVPVSSFPWMFLIPLLIGVFFSPEWDYDEFLQLFSWALIGISILRIGFWFWEFGIATMCKYLIIEVNSGNTYALKFYDEDFLNQVMDVFRNIFMDDGEQYKNLLTTINIQGGNIETIVLENPNFSKGSHMIDKYYDKKQ